MPLCFGSIAPDNVSICRCLAMRITLALMTSIESTSLGIVNAFVPDKCVHVAPAGCLGATRGASNMTSNR
jgi:hypothetical protein